MAKIVGAEERDKLTGLLLEILRQTRQKGGYPFDADKLADHLQEGIEGRFWSGLFDDVLHKHRLTRKSLFEIICMDGSYFFEAMSEIIARAEIGSNIQRHVGIVDKNTTSLNPQWIRAREIMGKNFLGVEEATRHYGIAFTEGQLAALAEIPFSEEVLEECKNTHVLVAGYPMTILDIRGIYKASKRALRGTWYDNQPFANDELVALRWHIILKTEVPNSTNKTYSDQKSLLSDKEEVPRASDFIYATLLYFMVTGERLFSHVYVRTSSVNSYGARVNVGNFDSNGLIVHDDWDDDRNSYIGVASARKPV